jgi:hypothetical protein
VYKFTVVVACEMADFTENCVCIKFCVRLEKTATGIYEMLKSAFGEGSGSYIRHFRDFNNLGKICPEGVSCTNYPSS